jgi:hypothetical protein
LFHIMTDEPIPSVKVAIQKEMHSLAARTASLDNEEDIPINLGDARNCILAWIVMRLARIQEIKPCLAARTADLCIQRTLVNRGFSGNDAAHEM